MMFSVISVTILLICAVCVLYETMKAKKNGFIRSLIALVNIFVSAVTALIISPALSYFIVQKNEKLLRQIDLYSSLNTSADT